MAVLTASTKGNGYAYGIRLGQWLCLQHSPRAMAVLTAST